MARAPNKLSFDCIESAAKKIHFEIRGMLQKLVDLQKIKGGGGLLQDKSWLTSCAQDSEDSRSRRPAGCRRKGRSRREGCGRLFVHGNVKESKFNSNSRQHCMGHRLEPAGPENSPWLETG